MATFETLLQAGRSLADDIELLKAFRDLATAWWRAAAEVEDLPSLEAFLELSGKDIESDVAKAAFAKLDAEALRVKIAGLVGKIAGAEAKIPEKYKLLLRKISTFDSAGADSDLGLAAWRLIDKETPLPVGDKFTLGLQTKASLEFEAGDAWRYASDAMPAPLLRISAVGDLAAKAGATLPFQPWTLGAKAATSAHAELHYYYDVRDQDALFGGAVAQRLTQLPSPFSFEAVWDAFATTDLAGVIYKFEGAASAEVEVSLADTLAFGAGVVGALGAAVKLSVDLHGGYALSFRAASPAQSGGRQIIATLSRVTGKGASAGLSLGLDIDLSSLAGRVHEILQKAINVWQGGLEKIQPYLSPGIWAQKEAGDLLSNAAKAIVDDEALRGAIVRDLQGALGIDTSDKSAVTAWVAGEVSGALDKSGLLTAAQGQADKVVDQLAGRLPAFAQAQFRDQLKAAVEALSGKVETAFKTEVDKLVGQDAAKIKALGVELKKAGEASKAVFASADDALAGARRLVARYDALFRKVVAEAEDAARRKVAAQVLFEESRDSETSYQFSGVLTGRNEGARAVFDALTRGDLKALLPLFDQPSSSGFDLDREKSSIRRFSKSESKLGYEVVLFGFAMNGATLLSGEAAALADGAGNIQIDTQGQLVKRFTGPTEGREISFVDVYGLRLLRALEGAPPSVRRALDVGVNLSHKDQSLKRGELVGFIQSLEDVGLLAANTTDESVKQFDAWRIDGSDKRLAADLNAKLWLTGKDPITLLKLGQRQNGQLTDVARRAIVEAGIQALLRAHAVKTKDFSEAVNTVNAELIGNFAKVHGRERTVAEVFLDYPAKWPPVGVNWTTDGQRHFDYFLQQHERLSNLVAMIDLMGDVYEASPADPRDPKPDPHLWDEREYRTAQRDIASTGRSWLKLNKKYLFWAGKDVHPLTVALLLAIVDLAGAPQRPMTLTMTYRPSNGPPQTVVLA